LSSTTIAPTSFEKSWSPPYKGQVGMLCLIAAESSIFTIFVVAYLYYIGKSLSHTARSP
jgi:cytochrome c oxidase subunit 3/cytochrome o ubiquinol oxidase subunit 3